MKVNRIILGDNVTVLRTFPDNSIDAIVTDSPYGLGDEPDPVSVLKDWIEKGYHDVKGKGFMGKQWDAFVPQPALWKECYRVLKPGGYLLSFFGTRTYDWGTLAIRLAGFEIRDCIQWIYGSGFPKSMDVSKAIDKTLGADREIVDTIRRWGANASGGRGSQYGNGYAASIEGAEKIDPVTVPASDEAKLWEGWGTALKPANEPICVARKPLIGTVAENLLTFGTGAINIDACRIETLDQIASTRNQNIKGNSYKSDNAGKDRDTIYTQHEKGRFPANVLLDDEAAALLDEQTGTLVSGKPSGKKQAGNNVYGQYGKGIDVTGYGDKGGASRFFYVAKASTAERMGRKHPTIKPIKLMRYLVRLVCPLGGICLDPHVGSGSTPAACHEEGVKYIGIDNDPETVEECKDFLFKRILGEFY